jgi:3-deoxy-7-phosphoheptulonate synthase
MLSKEFESIVDGLSDALDFSRTIGIDSNPSYEQGGGRGALRDVDFYTRFETLAPYCFHALHSSLQS